ncbi:MAG TPA: SDR family oxidoreductase [Candidatus Deferrimicrobiaceae bacterium]
MTSGGGKVALVTGGGRRIGAAVSRALGEAGYEVVLTYRSSRREAAEVAREVGGTSLRLNLSRPASFRRFADRIRDSRGRLDLLVHNAAVFPRTPVDTLSAAEWDAVFSVNLRGPALLTGALLPLLRDTPGAAVVFLGDANAGDLWPGYMPYCLSKLALERFARGLRKSLAPAVRVGLVRPGFALAPQGFPRDRWERLRAREGRRGIGSPGGVARAVLRFAEGGDYNS